MGTAAVEQGDGGDGYLRSRPRQRNCGGDLLMLTAFTEGGGVGEMARQ